VPTPLLVVAIAAATLLCLRGSLKTATATLLTVWMFVPANLRPPGSQAFFLTVPRLVLAAYMLNVAVRWRQGELADDAFRFTRVHVAFVALGVGAFVTGVALAGPEIPFKTSFLGWLRIADQLVFFVALLAATRTLGVRWTAGAVVAVASVAATIAIGERIIGTGWSEWMFRNTDLRVPGASGLALRGGKVRVQVAAQFPLEFAWVMTLLLPMTATAFRWGRRAALGVLPLLVLLAIALSPSRSSLAGLVLGAIVVLVCSRLERSVATIVIAGAIAAVFVILAVPSLREPFIAASKTGEAAIRLERLPDITEAVADRPYAGLGYGGLIVRGIHVTDISYVLVYGETGVIGLVLTVALWVTAIGATLPALRAPTPSDRVLAASIVAGVVLVPIAAGAYDFSSVLQSVWTLWVLVALGRTLAEHCGAVVPDAPRRISPARVFLPLAGVAIGTVAWSMVPAHSVASYTFETTTPRVIAADQRANEYLGRVLLNTACAAIDSAATRLEPAHASCRSLRIGFGVGSVRIEAPTDADVVAAARGVEDVLRRRDFRFQPHAVGVLSRARPTWAQAAPVALGGAGLALVFLVQPMEPPGWLRGRRRPLAAPAV
jgi:hypothetical protein